MIKFLKTANTLDKLQCYNLADKFTKMAIREEDLKFEEVYKKPQTIPDDILIKAKQTKQNPMDIIMRYPSITRQEDPEKALQELAEPSRRFHEIYPQIVLFQEDNLWKFFFTDPLSFKLLDKIKDKYFNPDDFITYDVLFTTNLNTKQTTEEQAQKLISNLFPDASIDSIEFGQPIDLRDQFDEEKYIAF